MFISTVLLGLRQVRTPLLAGALWLCTAWVVVGDRVLDQPAADSFEARVIALSNWVGVGGTIAALTLAAFLVGGLIPTALVKRPGKRAAEELSWWISQIVRESYQRIALEDLSNDQAPQAVAVEAFYYEQNGHRVRFSELFREGYDQDQASDIIQQEDAMELPPGRGYRPPIPGRWLHKIIKVGIESEFPRLRASLLQERPLIFSEIDRKESEADLRGAIFLPLSALIVAVASETSWWMTLGLIVPLSLYLQAYRLASTANLDFVRAITTGLVVSPTVEYVRGFNRRPQWSAVDEDELSRRERAWIYARRLRLMASWSYIWFALKELVPKRRSTSIEYDGPANEPEIEKDRWRRLQRILG